MKKTIVHIVPTFDIGGVQTGILYSLKDLNEKSSYTVLVIGKINHEWIDGIDKNLKQKIIWSGTNSFVLGYINAYKILKKIKPDVIISSLWKSVILSIVFKLFNRQTILLGFYHNTKSAHALDYIFSYILSKFSDASLTDSESTRLSVLKKFRPLKVFEIPYVFNFINKFHSKKTFNPQGIRFAYFGRVNKSKGAFRMIHFCKSCQNIGIKYTFNIYGLGDLEPISNLIKELGLEKQVFFRRLLPPNMVSDQMLNYDFLIQLSDYEGMALSVVEAMSHGLIPIVTPVGEIANYSKDGFNAIWLEKDFDKNIDQLANKLKILIKDKTSYEIISSNAQKAFDSYSRYTDSMIAAINSCMKNK
jgi:glycosyltransferase involved in cell wall biosynthesis